jgi:hypothetical protein
VEALRPETDTATLPDVLRALLRIEDSRDLEALLPTIHLDAITTTDDERARLLNAIASATARCWTRRWPTDCCGD